MQVSWTHRFSETKEKNRTGGDVSCRHILVSFEASDRYNAEMESLRIPRSLWNKLSFQHCRLLDVRFLTIQLPRTHRVWETNCP